MATKLGLYNAALREIGGTRLASLDEGREPRFILDDVYDQVVKHCLEQGMWNFAIRSVQSTAEVGVDPAFGYEYAFEKPSDWIRTAGLSLSEFFDPPLLDYTDENGYWWSNSTPLYVRYVSNDGNFGLDLDQWPETFTRFVEFSLARRISSTLTNSKTDIERLDKALRLARLDAQSKDAMNDPPMMTPLGSWVLSRGGSRISRNPQRV